jgi:hypothetical protein
LRLSGAQQHVLYCIESDGGEAWTLQPSKRNEWRTCNHYGLPQRTLESLATLGLLMRASDRQFKITELGRTEADRQREARNRAMNRALEESRGGG